MADGLLMLEDIRAYARSMLPSPGQPVSRDQYAGWVRSYAIEKHGQEQEVTLMADRTARHLWDSRPRG